MNQFDLALRRIQRSDRPLLQGPWIMAKALLTGVFSPPRVREEGGEVYEIPAGALVMPFVGIVELFRSLKVVGRHLLSLIGAVFGFVMLCGIFELMLVSTLLTALVYLAAALTAPLWCPVLWIVATRLQLRKARKQAEASGL